MKGKPQSDGAQKTILVVHQHEMIRDLYRHYLSAHASGIRVLEVGSAAAVGEAVQRAQIALILVPVLHKRTGALGADIAPVIAMLREQAPKQPIAVIADAEDAHSVVAVLQCGASGLIPLSMRADLLVHALNIMIAGGKYVPPSAIRPAATMEATPKPIGPDMPLALDFTPRQRDVLNLLLEAESNKSIAQRLNMTESTVKVHIRHIMKKLNARNRTQVVVALRSAKLRRRAQLGSHA